MTTWRQIIGIVVAVHLLAGPAVTPALPPVFIQAGAEEEDDVCQSELTLSVGESAHGRRTNERRAGHRRRSAVIPSHRHHATLVRPQAAPVSFQRAVNSPLHC